MKLLIVSLCVACACADVSHLAQGRASEAQAQILKQSMDVDPAGGYSWTFETDNGIGAQAAGTLENRGAEDAVLRVQGSASFKSPEGEQVDIEYIADENGYQPRGSHIPTPPPIPEAILRSLEYIRDHPPPPTNQ